MIARKIVVTGRVQGVGFRAYVEREARSRGLSGWVRNRHEGSVEALFYGEASAVEAMIEACRKSPRMARVDVVSVAEALPPKSPVFEVLPTG